VHGRARTQVQGCKERNKTGPFHVQVGFGSMNVTGAGAKTSFCRRLH
jgi:hypothetical protein